MIIKRGIVLVDRRFLIIIIWLVSTVSIVAALGAVEYFTTFSEAIRASVVFCVVGFNIASAIIIRDYTRQHHRNTVAWVTATIVFTPILAFIGYLLTWSKGQNIDNSAHGQQDKAYGAWEMKIGKPKYFLTVILVPIWLVGVSILIGLLSTPHTPYWYVMGQLDTQVDSELRSKCQVTAHYRGFGSWIVTAYCPRGTVELVFKEYTREFLFVGEWGLFFPLPLSD